MKIVKTLFVLSIVLAVSIAGIQLANLDHAYFIITFGNYQIENHLVVLALVVIVFYIVLWAVIKFIGTIWKLLRSVPGYTLQRKKNAASKHLHQGLLDLFAQRWSQAEQSLSTSVEYSDYPLLNDLGAAYAAFQQGAFTRSQQYLQQAETRSDKTEVAVLLAQVALQQHHNQIDNAKATLETLCQIEPEHSRGQALLAELYCKNQDWSELVKMLPKLRKTQAISEAELEKLSVATYQNILQQAAANDQSASAVTDAWRHLPKPLQKNSQLGEIYVRALLAQQCFREAEKFIVAYLNKQWASDLAALYIKVKIDKPTTLIKQAEAWVQQYPKDSDPLLLLARLYRREEQWQQAENYYRKVIEKTLSSEICAELADMLDQLGETTTAYTLYKQAYNLRPDFS